MSLKSFVQQRDVVAKLKPLRPKMPRKIGVPLKVEPRTASYQLVGTAFDYLLRFELQRRAPHARVEPWIAEDAAGRIGAGLFVNADPQKYVCHEEVAESARVVVDAAKEALTAYLKRKAPKRIEKQTLAQHAIRLAKLDPVLRVGRLDPDFEQVDNEDVEDLVELLSVVPYDDLLHPKVLLLNPAFGDASRLVGGADTDLIAGDLLVDFKTTKKTAMEVADLDQLLGYFLLARKQHEVDSTFPIIKRAGLYFSRHGHLWSIDTKIWTDHSDFLEVEKWFFERADEVRGAARASGVKFAPSLLKRLGIMDPS